MTRARATRLLRIAKLFALAVWWTFCALVLLVMLVITFSPNQ